jgi:hypothetical protein
MTRLSAKASTALRKTQFAISASPIGMEAIRKNLKAFIDTGFTAHHDVVEYWDGGPLKVFRGIVTMTPDDPGKSTVKPSMAHFFYMDKNDPTKVTRWIGAVGPVAF